MTTPIGTLSEVVVDCLDPAALVHFWHAVLGGTVQHQSDEWVALVPGSGTVVSFQRVPEPKAGKNRVHLDVDVPDLEAAASAAEALGARRVGAVVTDALGGFQVMLDPAGNEFCFVNGGTPVDA